MRDKPVLDAIMAALHTELDDVVRAYDDAANTIWDDVSKAVSAVLLDRGVERD